MTSRTITNAHRKIEEARKQGFYMEALLRSYHINLGLIKYLLQHSASSEKLKKGAKAKALFRAFFQEQKHNQALKTLITSASTKSVKTWQEKTENFFKSLKLQQPQTTKTLLDESEKIFGMLNISANKLIIRNRR